MPGKARKGSDADAARKLRKQLKKAENRVSKATKKRDDAQARLDALSVIAADLANRLAAAESAAAKTAGANVAKAAKPRPKRSASTTRRTRSTGASSTKAKPVSSSGSGATRST